MLRDGEHECLEGEMVEGIPLGRRMDEEGEFVWIMVGDSQSVELVLDLGREGRELLR